MAGISDFLGPLLIGGALFGIQSIFRSSSTQSSSSQIQQSAVFAPPPLPPVVPSFFIPGSGGEKDALTPLWTGIQNQNNKHGRLAKTFGTYKVFPSLAAEFVNVAEGNDNVGIGLLCLGEGEFEVTEPKFGPDAIADIASDYEILPGTLADPALRIYTNDYSQTIIAAALPYDTNVSRPAPQAGTQIYVDISFDNGLFAKDSEGQTITTNVQVAVEYRLQGTSDPWVSAGTISETQAATAARGHLTWDVTLGLYEVRLRRLTADSSSPTVVNACSWQNIRVMRQTPPVMPIKDKAGNTVPLGFVEFKATATDLNQGVLEQFNCILKRKLRTWNGSAWTDPIVTSNPAWILVALLTEGQDPQFTIGEIDGDEMKTWADFCDQKGFTFNHVFEDNVTLYEACSNVAASGRAVLNSDFTVTIDQKRTTFVQHFSPLNYWGLRYRMMWPRRPLHAIDVRFINASANYQLDQRIVYADGYSADGSNGTQVAQHPFLGMALVGCTNPDQAYKFARYLMASQELRRRRVSFYTDAEHAVLDRGDMVSFSSDTMLLGAGGGRIKTVTTNGAGDVLGCTINDTVVMTDGVSYYVRIRCEDGSSVHKQVIAVPGETSTLTFASPIFAGNPATKPKVGDHLQFGALNASVEMVVESIEPMEDFSALITLVDHAPEIYEADTGTIPPFNSNVQQIPQNQTSLEKPIIEAILTNEDVMVGIASAIQVRLTIPGNGITHFEAQFKKSTQATWNRSSFTPVGGGVVSLLPVDDGINYDLRIRHVKGNQTSAWETRTEVMVIGKTTKPPDVPYFTKNGLIVYWLYDGYGGVVAPRDLAGFQLRKAEGASANWDAATIIADLIQGHQFDISSSASSGPQTYMIKAVDIAGNFSENARFFSRNLGDLPIANVVESEDHHPTFPGDKTDCTVSGGILLADSDGSAYWGPSDSARHWSKLDTDPYWTETYKEMRYAFSYTPPMSLIGKQFKLKLQHDMEYESVTILYRGGGQNLHWDNGVGGDGKPYWDKGDSEAYWDADDPMVPMPDEIEGKIEKYEFEIIISSSRTIRGRINSLTVICDMADIEETLADVIIASGGTRLEPTKEFTVIKAITFAMGSFPEYPDAYQAFYLDKSVDGPLVEIRDIDGNSVDGIVDVTLKGY